MTSIEKLKGVLVVDKTFLVEYQNVPAAAIEMVDPADGSSDDLVVQLSCTGDFLESDKFWQLVEKHVDFCQRRCYQTKRDWKVYLVTSILEDEDRRFAVVSSCSVPQVGPGVELREFSSKEHAELFEYYKTEGASHETLQLFYLGCVSLPDSLRLDGGYSVGIVRFVVPVKDPHPAFTCHCYQVRQSPEALMRFLKDGLMAQIIHLQGTYVCVSIKVTVGEEEYYGLTLVPPDREIDYALPGISKEENLFKELMA